MKLSKKKLLVIISSAVAALAIALLIILIVSVNGKEHKHQWTDWQTVAEATCEQEGQQQRECACGKTEECAIPLISHSYTRFAEWEKNNVRYFSTACEYCSIQSETVYSGIRFDDGEVLIADCPQDFSFEILCDNGEAYIYKKLHVWNNFYKNLSYTKDEGLLEEYTVKKLGGNRYEISPKYPYAKNNAYTVELSGGLSFASFADEKITFQIVEEKASSYEYNREVLFLKKLQNETLGCNSLDFFENQWDETYTLVLSQADAFDAQYIGRVLCIGDCQDFAEAEGLPAEEVFFGEIVAVEEEGGNTVITLEQPTVADVYSQLNVNSNGEEVTAVNIDEPSKRAFAAKLLKSKAFASAVTTANVGASAYAKDYGFKTAQAKFDLDNLTVEVKLDCNTANEDGTVNTVTAILTAVYTHKIPVEQSGVEIGSIDFEIFFETSIDLDLLVLSNLSEYKLFDFDYRLQFSMQLQQKTEVDFRLSSAVNVRYSYQEEAYYLFNPDSGVIHAYNCRTCAGFADDTTRRIKYSEIADIPNYTDYECKICKPFTENKGFLLNKNTNTIHCINCESVKMISNNNVMAFSLYPIGYADAKNCDNCKPQDHAADLETYLKEGLKDSDWSVNFEKIQSALGDLFKGNQSASSIGEDAKPRITLSVACFEVPVYIQPNFDFDLKADFKFEYHFEVTDIYFAQLKYNAERNEKGKTKGYEFDVFKKKGTPISDFNLDVMGEMRAEIGAILEVRLGPKFISKSFYVGINCELGMYTELAGVLHMDSEKNDYYAARVEAGLYTSSAVTYEIKGILKAGGVDIVPKTDLPLYAYGDTRAYYAFADYNQTLMISGSSKTLDDGMLKAAYYDLTYGKMGKKFDNLQWKGSNQYLITGVFVDESGKRVNYCTLNNGVIYVSPNAPSEFEITLVVSVQDTRVPSNLKGYMAFQAKDNAAFFMDELHISVVRTAQSLEYALSEGGDYYIVVGIGSVTDSDIVIPAQYNGLPVKEIGAEAFVLNDRLTSVTISKGITRINESAFNACMNLHSVSIPDTVTHIGITAFTGSGLRSVSIPSSVTYMGKMAFSSCGNLLSVTVPGSVQTVSDYAFWRCESLTDVVLEEGIIFIGEGALSDCPILRLTLPGSLGEIEYAMFSWYTTLEEVTLGEGIERIEEDAFADCWDLNKIVLPVSLQYIGATAFSDSALSNIVYNGTSSQWLSIEKHSNWDVGIGNYSITYLGDGQYSPVQPPQENTDGTAGLRYKLLENGTYAVSGIGSATDTKIVVASNYNGVSVTAIADQAFTNCTQIREITLPDSITSVGYSAFSGCDNLTGKEYDNAYYIGSTGNPYLVLLSAKSKAITSCTIHENTKLIYEHAFEYCENLTDITIPDNVSDIGHGTFSDCYALERVQLPNGIKEIGIGTFNGCRSLKEIVIPDSVTTIHNDAFGGCVALERVELGSGVQRIGAWAFYWCKALKEIFIGSNVSCIDWDPFYACEQLTIYVEVTTQPAGWLNGWNYSGFTVVWGYKQK